MENENTEERKVRKDAVLRNLPEERQNEIGRMLMPGPGNKTQAEVREWLAQEGIVVSEQKVSQFWRWWTEAQARRGKLERAEREAVEWAAAHPDATPAEVFAMGQRIFARLAMTTADAKTWWSTQMLQIRRDAQGLSWERFRFSAAKAALKELPRLQEIEADNMLDTDEKIRAVRIALFGEAPE
jgi:hypothetical protein